MKSLNEMTNREIINMVARDPDTITDITLAMADAANRSSERLYVAATRLTDGINAGWPARSQFDEFMSAVAECKQTTVDTIRIFNATNDGARRAGL